MDQQAMYALIAWYRARSHYDQTFRAHQAAEDALHAAERALAHVVAQRTGFAPIGSVTPITPPYAAPPPAAPASEPPADEAVLEEMKKWQNGGTVPVPGAGHGG